VKVGRQRLGLGNLALADQDGDTALGQDSLGGSRENGIETLDRAQGDELGFGGEGFGALGGYIDVRQCKAADGFAEEDDFLVLRLEESSAELRSPELDWKAGKSGAGTDVEEIEGFGRPSGAARCSIAGWIGVRGDGGCLRDLSGAVLIIEGGVCRDSLGKRGGA